MYNYDWVNWLIVPWRAQEHDRIGGWCITPADDPRTPADGAPVIVGMVYPGIAKYMVLLHNERLMELTD